MSNVLAAIALAAATSITLNPGDTLNLTIGPVPLVESASDTHVPPSLAIVDAAGNVWTLTADGHVAVGGTADPVTSNVTQLAYEKHVLWQLGTGLWYSWNDGAWSTLGSQQAPVP